MTDDHRDLLRLLTSMQTGQTTLLDRADGTKMTLEEVMENVVRLSPLLDLLVRPDQEPLELGLALADALTRIAAEQQAQADQIAGLRTELEGLRQTTLTVADRVGKILDLLETEDEPLAPA